MFLRQSLVRRMKALQGEHFKYKEINCCLINQGER